MPDIGIIIKPQGIKGELKVKPLTDDPARFLSLKSVCLEGAGEMRVISAAVRGGYVYLRLAGIEDRNAAETLRDKYLSVKTEQALKKESGRYFIDELLGAQVYIGEELIGTVSDISNFGSADVYTVTGVRTVRFPFIKRLIVSVDSASKRIVLEPAAFSEVSVYED